MTKAITIEANRFVNIYGPQALFLQLYIQISNLLLPLLKEIIFKPHILFSPPQKESIMKAVWPSSASYDKNMLEASNYLTDAAHDFRKRLKAYTAVGKGKVYSFLHFKM